MHLLLQRQLPRGRVPRGGMQCHLKRIQLHGLRRGEVQGARHSYVHSYQSSATCTPIDHARPSTMHTHCPHSHSSRGCCDHACAASLSIITPKPSHCPSSGGSTAPRVGRVRAFTSSHPLPHPAPVPFGRLAQAKPQNAPIASAVRRASIARSVAGSSSTLTPPMHATTTAGAQTAQKESTRATTAKAPAQIAARVVMARVARTAVASTATRVRRVHKVRAPIATRANTARARALATAAAAQQAPGATQAKHHAKVRPMLHNVLHGPLSSNGHRGIP